MSAAFNFSIKVTDKSADAKKKIDDALGFGLEKCASQAQNYAFFLCPVDTGAGAHRGGYTVSKKEEF